MRQSLEVKKNDEEQNNTNNKSEKLHPTAWGKQNKTNMNQKINKEKGSINE